MILPDDRKQIFLDNMNQGGEHKRIEDNFKAVGGKLRAGGQT